MEPVGFWIYFSRINMIYAVKQDNSKGEVNKRVNMFARFLSYALDPDVLV